MGCFICGHPDHAGTCGVCLNNRQPYPADHWAITTAEVKRALWIGLAVMVVGVAWALR